MKFFLSAVTDEQFEDGPVITSPLGGVLVYHSMDEASDAARALTAGGTVKGVFVQKLVPVALYTPTMEQVFNAAERPEGN